jgi:hypothetical protein
MALTNNEVATEVGRWLGRNTYGAGGGWSVALPFPHPLWGLTCDAAARIERAAGRSVDGRTGESFLHAAVMLAIKATSGTPSDLQEFARAGYPSSGWFLP